MELTTRLLFLVAAFTAGVHALPAATPTAHHAPADAPATTSTPAPGAASPGSCTHTLNITYSRLPTPPYWPQCSHNGTESIHPSTQTVYRSVDCAGCANLAVNANPTVHCPARRITATATVATPKTEYRTVCSATPTAAPHEYRGGWELLKPRQGPSRSATCSTTMLVTAGLDGGPTSTIFGRFVTTTSTVSCGGCGLVLATKIGGQGPVYKPTATLTLTGTSTVFLCASGSL